VQVTILGAAGFLGRKLANRITEIGGIGGGEPVTALTLFDMVPTTPPPGAGFPVTCLEGDVTALPETAIPPGTAVVFHLAAVVSAQAEADYDLGLRVNLHGALAVADACRRAQAASKRAPRLVFTSSVATFSGGQDSVIADEARQVPANSYGAQKAAAELLLGDASRRGFLDLVALRLPTVVVRPGRPNRAASGFLSGIIREPLLGLGSELPVAEDFAAWLASPRRAVDWLLHAARLPGAELGVARGINPPGITVTVGEMIAALEQVRPGAARLIRRAPDPEIAAIVGTWPPRFASARARALGFAEHESFAEVVRAFIADDLAATRAERAAPT